MLDSIDIDHRAEQQRMENWDRRYIETNTQVWREIRDGDHDEAICADLDTRTIMALLRMNLTHDVDEFRTALATTHADLRGKFFDACERFAEAETQRRMEG